jgi:hypothetical protein
MKRREFIAGLGSAAAWLLGARAQQQAGKRPVIGILALKASEKDTSFVTTFLDMLAKLGYVHGKSATIVSFYAAGEQRLLPTLAGNLVRLNPGMVMADAASSKATRAPSSFAVYNPRRLRASGRGGGGVVNRPPSPFTMLLSRHTRRREFIAGLGGSAAARPLTARPPQGELGATHRRARGGRRERSRVEDFRICVHASACGLGLDRWSQRADGPSVGPR